MGGDADGRGKLDAGSGKGKNDGLEGHHLVGS